MSCDKCETMRKKCADSQAQLDTRNESTKAWIQSDTQVRVYANKLEKRVEPGLAIKAGLQEIQRLIACGTTADTYLATVRLHKLIDIVAYEAKDAAPQD